MRLLFWARHQIASFHSDSESAYHWTTAKYTAAELVLIIIKDLYPRYISLLIIVIIMIIQAIATATLGLEWGHWEGEVSLRHNLGLEDKLFS